jgi:hypothetical protein
MAGNPLLPPATNEAWRGPALSLGAWLALRPRPAAASRDR